jgi:hypothetical protein
MRLEREADTHHRAEVKDAMSFISTLSIHASIAQWSGRGTALPCTLYSTVVYFFYLYNCALGRYDKLPVKQVTFHADSMICFGLCPHMRYTQLSHCFSLLGLDQSLQHGRLYRVRSVTKTSDRLYVSPSECRWVKRPERKANHLLISSAKVKYE